MITEDGLILFYHRLSILTIKYTVRSYTDHTLVQKYKKGDVLQHKNTVDTCVLCCHSNSTISVQIIYSKAIRVVNVQNIKYVLIFTKM